MLRPLKTPSSELLQRIFDTPAGVQTPSSDETSAERARIHRERVRRMLVRSFLAGSVR